MENIRVEQESLVTLKGELAVLKENFNASITNIKTNLEKIESSWKGRKATNILSNIEVLTKTNTDLLTRIEENINYIQSVIETVDKANAVEVKKKATEAPSLTANPTPSPTPSPTPESTSMPTTVPTQTIGPTTTIDGLTTLGSIPIITPSSPITPTSTAAISRTTEPIEFDNRVINDLGLKTSKSGSLLMVGNAYVGNINGMDFLVHLPKDKNGNIITNSSVFIEFHGSGEAGKNMNITNFPQGRMGLRQIEEKPNFEAIIIIPQVENPNYYASEYDKIHRIQETVISTLDADRNKVVAYGHSAGATGGMKYVASYPEGVKLYVSVDGRPDPTFIEKLRGENIPILFANSNTGKETPYNVHVNNLMSRYPEYENSSYNVNDIGIDGKVSVAIENLTGTNYLKAFYLIGSTHSTVRDRVINASFYDSVLKTLKDM